MTAPVTGSVFGVATIEGRLPMRSGRTADVPVMVVMFVRRFTGFPVCACSTTTICQPSFKRLPWNGSSYDRFTAARWRTSKSDRPSLSFRSRLFCSAPLLPPPVPSYELVSVDFDSVYEPDSCRPFDIR